MPKSKSAYSIPGKIGKIERHIIVVWVDNEAGVCLLELQDSSLGEDIILSSSSC